MLQAVSAHSTTALTVSDIDTTVNCEPRVLDTKLGKGLGMARPTNIRSQIEANRAELESFGPLHAARAKVGIGSGAKREVVSYYLTEGQALCICALSRAPNAPQVRRALIEAFMELRRRQIEAATGKLPVRAYTRTPRKPKLFDGSQSGRGCVVLDKPVFFDASRRPAVGEPALVVLHDGTLAVLPICEEWTRPDPGYVYVEDKAPPKGALSFRSKVALIGAITTSAGRPKQIA